VSTRGQTGNVLESRGFANFVKVWVTPFCAGMAGDESTASGGTGGDRPRAEAKRPPVGDEARPDDLPVAERQRRMPAPQGGPGGGRCPCWARAGAGRDQAPRGPTLRVVCGWMSCPRRRASGGRRCPSLHGGDGFWSREGVGVNLKLRVSMNY